MNKRDVFGKKQGYWEEIDGEIAWKGRYINDIEEGVWKRYRSDVLSQMYFYDYGIEIYGKVWTNDNHVLYNDYNTTSSSLIHIEENE